MQALDKDARVVLCAGDGVSMSASSFDGAKVVSFLSLLSLSLLVDGGRTIRGKAKERFSLCFNRTGLVALFFKSKKKKLIFPFVLY